MSLEVLVRVMRTSKATGADYLLLIVLAERAQPHGVCWPGIKTLARDAHLEDERSAQRGLLRLRTAGEVDVLAGGGRRTNTYWLRRYANPLAVDEFINTTDLRFDDVRQWMRALLAADVGNGGVYAGGMVASTPGVGGGVYAGGMVASTPPLIKTVREPQQQKPPGEPARRAVVPQPAGSGDPGSAARSLAWDPLLERISASFGGLPVIGKDGQAKPWAGQTAGLIGAAAGGKLAAALALWGEFDGSEDRRFVKNPARSLPAQVGAWLGQRAADERKRRQFMPATLEERPVASKPGVDVRAAAARRRQELGASDRWDGVWLDAIGTIAGGVGGRAVERELALLRDVVLLDISDTAAVFLAPTEEHGRALRGRIEVPITRILGGIVDRPLVVEVEQA